MTSEQREMRDVNSIQKNNPGMVSACRTWCRVQLPLMHLYSNLLLALVPGTPLHSNALLCAIVYLPVQSDKCEEVDRFDTVCGSSFAHCVR
jgi:hypothetical protein